MKNDRTYHGWIVIEKNSPGFKDAIWVEWRESAEATERRREQVGYGESGAANAVEWWDARLGQHANLEPLGRIGYRVYTTTEISLRPAPDALCGMCGHAAEDHLEGHGRCEAGAGCGGECPCGNFQD